MIKKKDLFSTILDSSDSYKEVFGYDDLECHSCGWIGKTDDGVIHNGSWSCPECFLPAKQYSDDILHCISPSCNWWDHYSSNMEKEDADFLACPDCGSHTAWGVPFKIQKNK